MISPSFTKSTLQLWQNCWWRTRVNITSATHRFHSTHALPTTSSQRDRVDSKGEFIPSTTTPPTKPTPKTPYVIGTSICGRVAPEVPPVSDAELDQLAEFIVDSGGGNNLIVITGAGCSTESNVPDYRGPNGAYTTGFKPMTHQQFMASSENRSRYWARSFAGWAKFSKAEPNAAHDALSRLQKLGWVGTIITQNVDRLHHKAGSNDVLEIHGTTHEICCTNCGTLTPREKLQQRLASMNPEAAAAVLKLSEEESKEQDMQRLMKAGTATPVAPNFQEQTSNNNTASTDNNTSRTSIQRPDGDVELTDTESLYTFQVPQCDNCGGILKPHVVFFGDSVPPDRTQRALQLSSEASHVLAVGTSLSVWSAYRLVKAAVERGENSKSGKLALVNVGTTRADDLASLKVPGLAGETLIRLAAHPRLLIPPY